jgi:glycerophosphoryl diester phosphodiesterase
METLPTLDELAQILPIDVALALELKSDRFLEEKICGSLLAKLEANAIRDRTVLLSFNEKRLGTFRKIDPAMPLGWIHMSRIWPRAGFEMLGPFWPLVFLNPFYVYVAQSRGQLICPLDPTPESRLWYYRRIGCDAILSNDPGKTCRALQRVPRAPTR